MCSSVLVMVTFGIENSSSSFRLFDVGRCDTLGKLMEKFGPDNIIIVTVSQSKTSSFDKFNLNNSAGSFYRSLFLSVVQFFRRKKF